MKRIIVGLGGLLSDPACCVIVDGQLRSAVEQLKVSRSDRPGSFPDEAFALALSIAGVAAADITQIALARPLAALAESDALLQLRARFPQSTFVVVEHHLAHAASAYYASGFKEASVLSVDRAGDFRSAALFRGKGEQLIPLQELYYPDSLGDLFNRVTELLGFEARADEHKVQWLSTYGKPLHRALFEKVIALDGEGWPRFDRSFFDADRLERGGFSAKFYDLLGVSTAVEITAEQKADIAASLQEAVALAVGSMLGRAEDVCLAGGLAQNTLLIQALERRFRNVFVQPAATNAGTALGAAFYASQHGHSNAFSVPFQTLNLGPSYPAPEIKQVLENCKLRFRYLLTEGELIREAVRAINDNKIVGWMQGRMEFGPRALGNRSILASPLNPYSTENLNIYIKHREPFRKFAASVPEELASQYFAVGPNARFLATAGTVLPQHKNTFAAALLGADSIRVHTVSASQNPLYHSLLLAAGDATGLPVLYNTSFNLFGDPLVCTPRDAVRSFYSSGIDALFAGPFFLEK